MNPTPVSEQPNGDVPTDAPESCPGTSSTMAGRTSACAGCPNQSICSSGIARKPDPDLITIQQRLSSIKHKILILSGKGGVGKTTVSVMIARALAAQNLKVSLLDVDICGPSIPRALGIENEQVHQSSSGWSPVYIDENFSTMSVGFLLESLEQAVIWKGPRKDQMIKRFLLDVDWDDDLDYLIIDTPPGTSDEHLSVVNYLKHTNLDGCILVTTPQEIALQDVRKEISFCKQTNLNVLGIIENMAKFICSKCHKESVIFKPATGGAKKLCEENQFELLESIPLDPNIARCCDDGLDFFQEHENSQTAITYKKLVNRIRQICEIKNTSI
ncbi:unnamed protein product [Didymodactylos carnosus]|uniref:Cytosolic Fe-S cluster assembly factor NUBP1 homolog n=1 Tax=Didymodactylos carnosus TaxID=1234261 RepID=A0A813S3Q6_9BILA|nr:unnamed protein product [Didymodactylos carnosus]CAF0931553.1 unnamed protein product [Didymodactylos carnosus]CAF3578070.1 unnamed protein product [Didymodactylos carnosus]CAF3708010.1 unnamed protein product [Didymodactylos carnosus]